MKNPLLLSFSRWLGRSLGLALVTAFAGAAHAEPVVLAVDGNDIYIDLGARDGVGAGTELELLHEVVVRDPRSGTTLRDHFALGTLAVVKSGDKVSVARASEGLGKRVLAGDRVRMLSAKRTFIDPWKEQVDASKPSPVTPPVTPTPSTPSTTPGKPVDHAELVRVTLESTLGKPPEDRVERWLELLRAQPRTPYLVAIQREIATLRAQITARDTALAQARSADTHDRGPRIARLAALIATDDEESPLIIAPVQRAEPGKPIEMSFLVRVPSRVVVQMPSRVARAWLYVRPPGEPGFRRIELVAHGDAYLRATIDGALVRAPRLQWYVDVAATADGEPEAVLGSQAAPRSIAVEAAVGEAPIESGRSHIDAHVDYVDFDGDLNNGFDQYYQAEIDFTYRFIKPVYAVRLGFGTLSGTGGPKDVIDADPDGKCLDEAGIYQCKSVTFSYVYTEIEYRVRPNVALMIRPQAGLLTTDRMPGGSRRRCEGADIEGCEFFTGFGGRVRLRLGDEATTNLVIGAGFTDGIGTLLEAAYNWRPVPTVPVQLSVQVTDQPVPEDFGVRLIGDVGWRKLSWFYPSLRLSYQARDIDHAGFSGGLAMNFDW
ncbi:MAG: hypothetical protein H0T89_19285 [Deltaproteobacteria bacterium]|nr:hypothetical protein [Deltaproteobacteria bacterium]MDQ3300420.1 hypothetical protein [Myxococcota bacterium]